MTSDIDVLPDEDVVSLDNNNVTKNKKPSRRSGHSNKTIMFYTVDGRNQWMKDRSPEDIQKVLKAQIAFLNETLLTKDNYTRFSTIVNNVPGFKDHFREYAVETEEGHVSKGIEAVCHSGIFGQVLSRSSYHIGIAFSNIYAINVNFKPGFKFQYKLEKLGKALRRTPKDCKVVIGGNFNISPEEPEFQELKDFLDKYEIGLVSNPTIPTYFNKRKVKDDAGIEKEIPAQTAMDHVFAHQSLVVVECTVGSFRKDGVGVGHEPAIVVVKVKRKWLKKRKFVVPKMPKEDGNEVKEETKEIELENAKEIELSKTKGTAEVKNDLSKKKCSVM